MQNQHLQYVTEKNTEMHLSRPTFRSYFHTVLTFLLWLLSHMVNNTTKRTCYTLAKTFKNKVSSVLTQGRHPLGQKDNPCEKSIAFFSHNSTTTKVDSSSYLICLPMKEITLCSHTMLSVRQENKNFTNSASHKVFHTEKD